MKPKKVLVALSGGVDSAVSAALLKKQNFDVIGVSLKVWPTSDCSYHRDKMCCSARDIKDARLVCSALKIPFYVLNVEKEFKKTVIDYFMSTYLAGMTPNPCIICNEKIKFGLLMDKAKSWGMDYIATGHYARIRRDDANGAYILQKAIDKTKDQSYFLCTLKKKQLKKILFPVGSLTKDRVRAIARRLKLPVHDKPGSQDICFIRDKNPSDYIAKNSRNKGPGAIVDISGKILGRHKGIFNYTIGQRRGLGIADKKPLYVLRIDAGKNEVVVGDKEGTKGSVVYAGHVNWMQPKNRTYANFRCKAKIRYNNPPSDCVIAWAADGKICVRFKKRQEAITPGQAIALYKGQDVVAGGWISFAN